MFKINSRTVRNKCTREKSGPEKMIVQYLTRTMQRVNLTEKKNNRTCTIIQYPRVIKIGEIHLHFLIQKAN